MNSIIFFVEEFIGNEILDMHGIVFRDCIVVRAVVDGELIHEMPGFDDSLIYFPELLRSLEGAGRYLIFTSSNGIAEDGGWDGVAVDCDSEFVSWSFVVGEVNFFYRFQRDEYFSEIGDIAAVVNKSSLRVEPTDVVFPEMMAGPEGKPGHPL